MEKHQYNASSIEVLEGLEAVRQKIGMYAGTHSAGLHQCVYELLSNSNDEAMNGYGKEILLTLTEDGRIRLRDYGRGIPYEEHPKYKKSTLTLLFTQLHAGGKMQSSEEYKNSGGTHGVGIKICTATCLDMLVRVWRGDGKMASQSFRQGKATSDVIITDTREVTTGTEITYLPELDIFGKDVVFEPNRLKDMCRTYAYLSKGITFRFTDEKKKKEDVFCFQHGIIDMYRDLVPSKESLIKNPIYLQTTLGHPADQIEIVFGYMNGNSENIRSFCNGLRLVEGGTHVSGFRAALTRAINEVARNNGSLKPKDANITGSELKDGLVSILSLKIRKPLFENQTKTKLSNPDIAGQVQQVLGDYLKRWMEDNPKEAQVIIDKILQTRRIREATKKAREAVLGIKKTKKLSDSLVGKLADCTGRNREENELWICEGDSAAGALKQARDAKTQAVLPLLGKILNTQKETDLGKILDNGAIRNLLKALGCDIQEDYSEKKLRYGKVVIATDADTDNTLHLTVVLHEMFK